MKKRIVLLLLAALLLTGCGKAGKAEKEDASRFITIENNANWRVVADRYTGVMYAVSMGGYNRGTYTLLVDKDGNPLLYDGGKNDGE